MTRHHFIALAKALADTRPAIVGATLDQWHNTREAIADVCARSNIRFDREIFEAACMASQVETVT